MTSRSRFSPRVAQALARLAGNRCSMPDCRASTLVDDKADGAQDAGGVALRIADNWPGAKRYDAALTLEERGSSANGLWLCRSCAGIVEDDVERFPRDMLRAMKVIAEARAARESGSVNIPVPAEGRAPKTVRGNGDAGEAKSAKKTEG